MVTLLPPVTSKIVLFLPVTLLPEVGGRDPAEGGKFGDFLGEKKDFLKENIDFVRCM